MRSNYVFLTSEDMKRIDLMSIDLHSRHPAHAFVNCVEHDRASAMTLRRDWHKDMQKSHSNYTDK
jgi:hypothetical protein